MSKELPTSVRYVKNGKSSQWWKAAQKNGQIHAGWKNIPDELLVKQDIPAIEKLLLEQYGEKRGSKQDINQVCSLLVAPSQHIWVTFEDGFLWWCTVVDGVTMNPDGETSSSGHFWLTCDRRWSKASVNGRPLAVSDLPGTVTTTAGFRATVCTPKDWQSILRLIKDETDKDAINSAERR
jgi:hypothetical protein